MVELTRKLVKRHPSGVLFRDDLGRGFTKNVRQRWFLRLRKKLPGMKHFSAYSYRHTYTTEALMNGVGIAQVAELLGHTGTTMVMQHYQHLNQKVDHMRELAAKATGAGKG